MNPITSKLPGTRRARDIGVPFRGITGSFNAITDVRGVEVGHTTLIAGEGKLKRGSGPVRTGVSAIWPRGKRSIDPVFGAWFSLNGNGEVTGMAWLDESGLLEGPVLITNTHSVGTVRDAYISWQIERGVLRKGMHSPDALFSLPVVAETWDGFLNDVNGFHVKPEHVFHALDTATNGYVEEGNVGSGTGMICYGFKAGIGTSSRQVSIGDSSFTVGVLAQCNCGRRPQLRIAGVPIGEYITDCVPDFNAQSLPESGSIIILIATDAPLLPHQLKRLARRATMGLALTGSVAGNGSGDMFIAFSTANASIVDNAGIGQVRMVQNDQMDPLFSGTVEASEEAIVNALIAAKTMSGVDGHTAIALPHDRLRELLKQYNRLEQRC
jgi:L-aminopeptidase/D-esterase-like protein